MQNGVSIDLLTSLRVASEAITKSTDDFNTQLKAIEESLASYNIGVSLWIKAFEETWDDCAPTGELLGLVTTEYFLGYQKSGGKWSLMLASECDYGCPPDKPDRTEWVFRDAPRQLRLKAMPAIPTLIMALIAEANRLPVELIANTIDARIRAD